MFSQTKLPLKDSIRMLLIIAILSLLTACEWYGSESRYKPIFHDKPPEATNVTIVPPIQPGQLIKASYTYVGDNPEGDSLYLWQIDNEQVATTLSFTLPLDSEGKALSFCVTPVAVSGDEKQGQQVCVAETITGQYSMPTITDLTLSSPITTGVEISASYIFVDENSRSEGDSLYSWQVDENEVGTQTTITLSSDNQDKMLTLCVTPVAALGENATGEAVCSQAQTIMAKEGQAPSIENLSFSAFAKAGNQISISYDFVDEDGDTEGESLMSWSIDNNEMGQENSLLLPLDSQGKLLSFCITPVALTGIPTTGEQACINTDIADIVVSGELALEETITLEIKGYTVNGVSWKTVTDNGTWPQSNNETEYIIKGKNETDDASQLVGKDIHVCIDTTEEDEICLSLAEQPSDMITGGLPTEIDGDFNITKRVVAPLNYIDLTISGVTKRLHRPLNDIESILLNHTSAGSVPLHTGTWFAVGTEINWTMYDHATATASCDGRGMMLPVQGKDDTSAPHGLQQFYDAIISRYPQFEDSHVVRGMSWPGLYFRSSSFQGAGFHYDFYLVTGDASYIDDATSEAAGCLSTPP